MSSQNTDQLNTAARQSPFTARYGPWALVTGASDGIGQEIARVLAERGLNLVLVARRAEALRKLCVELARTHGVACTSVSADLSTDEGCAAVCEATDALDVGLLVAAAGFGTSGDFVRSTLDAERQMLAVNCRAVLELVGCLAPRMVARGSGGILLMSSVLAFQGAPRSAHYAATKSWVQTFAEGLHGELGAQGVDVLACAPGPVNTGFASRANLKMGMALTPEVVARVAVASLGRRGTVRPGWLSKFLGWSLATLPRRLRVTLMAKVMDGMTWHQRNGTPISNRKAART